MKKIYFVGLCVMVAMSGCKKRYVSPLEAPVMTKAAAEKPFEFDFIQLNNDVIENLQDEAIYSFVKDLTITGDNEKKEITLGIEISNNVSEDAVELLLTDATKAIVDATHTQDFRIDEYDSDGFGNMFEHYSYKYIVSCGETVVREETIKAGESIPFDVEYSMENVIG